MVDRIWKETQVLSGEDMRTIFCQLCQPPPKVEALSPADAEHGLWNSSQPQTPSCVQAP